MPSDAVSFGLSDAVPNALASMKLTDAACQDKDILIIYEL